MDLQKALTLLPQAATGGNTPPERLVYTVMAPPKWGKTSMFAQVPDAVLLATEQGHAFVKMPKIIIDSWNRPAKEQMNGWDLDPDGNPHASMVEAVEAIVASNRFNFVIVDTADMAARMCVDYHCAQMKVNHPSEAGDFGKGYELTLTSPFRRLIGKLIHAGRGLAFITHTKWVQKMKKDVIISAKWETSLPSQAQAFLHTQSDIIFFGEFGKLRKGQFSRDRVVRIDGSEEIMAGSRVPPQLGLPPRFITDPTNPWKQWTTFFRDPVYGQEAYDHYLAVADGKDAVAPPIPTEPTSEVDAAATPESTD